jgi:hypothetical protein
MSRVRPVMECFDDELHVHRVVTASASVSSFSPLAQMPTVGLLWNTQLPQTSRVKKDSHHSMLRRPPMHLDSLSMKM